MKIPNRKDRKYQKTLIVDGDSLIKTAYYGAKDLYHKDIHILPEPYLVQEFDNIP